MAYLRKLDIYLNALCQMGCTALRKAGIHSVWPLAIAQVWALYFFLVCAGMNAVMNDLFGLLACSLVAVLIGVHILGSMYELFLVMWGRADEVDVERLKTQRHMLDKKDTSLRPVLLGGALLFLFIDIGTSRPIDPFAYGTILFTLSMYLETSV